MASLTQWTSSKLGGRKQAFIFLYIIILVFIHFRELLIIGGVAARDQLSVLDNGVSCTFNVTFCVVILTI